MFAGGIELWILSSWLDMSQPTLVLFSHHKTLLVSLRTIVGHRQVVVAHAIDSSYPRERVLTWWRDLRAIPLQLLVRGVTAVWVRYANYTVGSVQSEAIDAYHPEDDSGVGAEG